VQPEPWRLVVAAGDLDLAQRQRSAAQRLQRSLLGREAGREVAPGPMARTRVRQLAVGEQPFGEPRPPLERPLEPSNLEQIDPDPGRQRVRREKNHYSTVTVFARFRGWSTFSPLSLATR
jgi:hypothetical protein